MQLKFSLIKRQDKTSLCTDISLVICPLAITIGRRHIGIEICFECIYCLKAKIPRLFPVLVRRLSFHLDYVIYIQKTIVLEAFSAGTSTY